MDMDKIKGLCQEMGPGSITIGFGAQMPAPGPDYQPRALTFRAFCDDSNFRRSVSGLPGHGHGHGHGRGRGRGRGRDRPFFNPSLVSYLRNPEGIHRKDIIL